MATAYHLEALRKQRVLDRAYGASQKLQLTNSGAPSRIERIGTPCSTGHQELIYPQEESRPAEQEGSRPPSGLRSRPQSAQGRVSTTSQPHVTNEGVAPDPSLGANEAAVSVPAVVERKMSRPSSAYSQADSLGRRPLSPDVPHTERQEMTPRSVCNSTHSSRAESRMEAIRRDLMKQEKILHNNNLVMGPVSVEQEISDKATPNKTRR